MLSCSIRCLSYVSLFALYNNPTLDFLHVLGSYEVCHNNNYLESSSITRKNMDEQAKVLDTPQKEPAQKPAASVPERSGHGHGCTATAPPVTSAHFHATSFLAQKSLTLERQIRVKGAAFIP